MNADTHSQLANFIWSICNLLHGPYKRNEYRKVKIDVRHHVNQTGAHHATTALS